MKQAISNIIGISGIALIGILLLPLGVSAAIPGNIDETANTGKATTIYPGNTGDIQTSNAVVEENSQPEILADSCWIYIGGIYIYICNHDEVPINKI